MSYTPPETPIYPTAQHDPPTVPTAGLGAGTTTPSTAPSGGNDTGNDTKTVAKDQAASVGHGAAEAGQHVAGVAKDQAKQVTGEARQQATQLLHQARGQANEQASAQQQKLASGLRSLSDELHSMSSNAEQKGLATDLAHEAATRTGSVADWLGSREPAALLSDVSDFARRKPGTFLAVAAGVGFLAGRLTRGLKEQSSDSSDGSDVTGISTNYPPTTTPTPYPMSQSGYASGPPQTASLPEVNLNDPTLAPITPVPASGQVQP